MAKRPCLNQCGRLTTGTRCPECERGRDQARGSSSQRGYGAKHQAHRSAVKPLVDAGLTKCWRCGQRINPGEPWDDGHDDHDRTKYRGPEHMACNRATSGRR